MKIKIQRDRVRSFILAELMSGRIDIGDRLSLPYFAKKLKCSVTPIREALTQLEYAKIIEAIPNRGFIIPNTDQREARNLYELIAALECLAVENSIYDARKIKTLIACQIKFREASNTLDRILADFSFHEELTSLYDNEMVQEKIRDCKIRIFTYEKSYLSEVDYAIESVDQHQKIINAIQSGDNNLASSILKQNWLHTLNQIKSKM
ncbi:MAG: GntR family transcriptional regulator [Cyclobacteriaceae bacterium]|nr:GntR family transcriptional regulator [Cyclobacteriaceae bacterium]